jgi:hypothetical protein
MMLDASMAMARPPAGAAARLGGDGHESRDEARGANRERPRHVDPPAVARMQPNAPRRRHGEGERQRHRRGGDKDGGGGHPV